MFDAAKMAPAYRRVLAETAAKAGPTPIRSLGI
jgi:hypothetical protein